MLYRKLGRSDEEISVIGLGGIGLEGAESSVCADVIAAAVDAGVNYFDVFQPQPDVRDKFGAAIKGKRDRLHITAHLGACYMGGQYARSRDVRVCREFFEDYLRRMGTDYADVCMIHFIDEPEDYDAMRQNGIVELARELVREGKARFIGLSSHAPTVALRAVNEGYLDLLMFPVNPVVDAVTLSDETGDFYDILGAGESAGSQGVSEPRRKLYAACRESGTSIIAMKPYLAGHLFDPNNGFGFTMTPTQCLEYTLGQTGVTAAVPGCAGVAELREALGWLTASPEEKNCFPVLKNARLWAGTKTCMYCNHCLPCPKNINVAEVTRLRDLALTGMTDALRARYAALDVKASACVKCGRCEKNCPFGLPVRENMARAAELFET